MKFDPRDLSAVPKCRPFACYGGDDFRRPNSMSLLVPTVVGGGPTLDLIRRHGLAILQYESGNFRSSETTAESPAAIIFTSGSTGPAKGVLYRHGNFNRQVTEIRDFLRYSTRRNRRLVFPVVRAVQCRDGSDKCVSGNGFQPTGQVEPRNIIAAVNDWQATQAFGSPAVWDRRGPILPAARAAIAELAARAFRRCPRGS